MIKIEKKAYYKALAVALLLVALLYLIFNWIMASALHSRAEVIVPDLKGKSLYEAMKTASASNLAIKMEGEEFDQNVPVGTVIRQNPYSGITVREGKVIKITVSQGGEVIFVPDTIGKSVRSARIAIDSASLNLGEETSKYSVVTDKECVISQDPKPGSVVEKDSMVNLIISAGPPPANVRLMPDFVGKDLASAQKWAKDNNIDFGISQEPSDKFLAGQVFKQDPVADADLSDYKKVFFIVASSAAASGGAVGQKKFYYEIPAGGTDMHVKLTLVDSSGEKEIFNGTKPSGSKIDMPINPKGQAKVRVFVNDVLVEERDIE